MRKLLFGSAAVAALFIGANLASAQAPSGQGQGQGQGARNAEHGQPAQAGRNQGTQGAAAHDNSGKAGTQHGAQTNAGTQRGAQNDKAGASSEGGKGSFGQARAQEQKNAGDNGKQANRPNAREDHANAKDNHGGTAENCRNGNENRRNTAENCRNERQNGRNGQEEGTRQNAGTTTREGGTGSAQANTGRSGGTNVSLSTEQRGKICTALLGEHVSPARNVTFQVRVGTVIPTSVVIHPLPTQIVTIEPAWRGYEFFLVGSEIVIVDPDLLRIIAVMPA